MNETNWWDKRPYRTCGHVAEHYCFCEDATYDIPAIISAVREEERKRIKQELLKDYWIKSLDIVPKDESVKGHGSCCYCSQCGHSNEGDCVCESNAIIKIIDNPSP